MNIRIQTVKNAPSLVMCWWRQCSRPTVKMNNFDSFKNAENCKFRRIFLNVIFDQCQQHEPCVPSAVIGDDIARLRDMIISTMTMEMMMMMMMTWLYIRPGICLQCARSPCTRTLPMSIQPASPSPAHDLRTRQNTPINIAYFIKKIKLRKF